MPVTTSVMLCMVLSTVQYENENENEGTREYVWETVEEGTLPGEPRKHWEGPSVRYGAQACPVEGGFIWSQGYYYGHHIGKPMWVGDTWKFSYNFLKWERVAMEGQVPTGRYKYTLTSIDNGEKLIMFGGDDGGHLTSTTHVWGAFKGEAFTLTNTDNYAAWTKQDPESTPRQGHTTVTHKGFLIIFGGMTSPAGEKTTDASDLTEQNDIVIYNSFLNVFENIKYKQGQKVPPPRRSHVAVRYNEHMYIHGGFSRGTEKNLKDFWSLNLDALIDDREVLWEDLSTLNSPFGRGGHVMVADILLGKAWLHGGAVCTPGCVTHTDLWEYDFLENSWSEIHITRGMKPVGRHFHTAVLDQNNHRLYLTGGEAYSPYGYFNDVWRISMIGRKPDERYVNSAIVYDGIPLKTIMGRKKTTLEYLEALKPPVYKEHSALVSQRRYRDASRLLDGTRSTWVQPVLMGMCVLFFAYLFALRFLRHYLLKGKRDD